MTVKSGDSFPRSWILLRERNGKTSDCLVAMVTATANITTR